MYQVWQDTHVPFDAAIRQSLSGTPGVRLRSKWVGLGGTDSKSRAGDGEAPGQQRPGDCFPHGGFLPLF